jgi:hypothetical protein
MPCGSSKIRRFGGNYRFHRQGERITDGNKNSINKQLKQAATSYISGNA